MLVQKQCMFALLFFISILGGCATSRTELKIASLASEPAPTVTANPRTIVIRSVKDERVFEQAPSSPSTPSLGFEGASLATDELMSRAIGRKRNMYGKALGDFLLEKGRTVTELVRENVAVALRQTGYRVVTDQEALASAIIVDVRIKQFWTWFSPGFFTISLQATIETDIDVSGSSPS